MSITLTCPCGASMVYVGGDIYGRSHADKFHAEHRECEPVKPVEPVMLRAIPARRIAGWRR